MDTTTENLFGALSNDWLSNDSIGAIPGVGSGGGGGLDFDSLFSTIAGGAAGLGGLAGGLAPLIGPAMGLMGAGGGMSGLFGGGGQPEISSAADYGSATSNSSGQFSSGPFNWNSTSSMMPYIIIGIILVYFLVFKGGK